VPLLRFLVFYDLSGRTIWTASYVKRSLRILKRRSVIKTGQMLKEFREKRENIIHLKVGRKNKVAMGKVPPPGTC